MRMHTKLYCSDYASAKEEKQAVRMHLNLDRFGRCIRKSRKSGGADASNAVMASETIGHRLNGVAPAKFSTGLVVGEVYPAITIS